MRHNLSRLGWLVAVAALTLVGSACDMPDPGDWPGGSDGTNTEISTATEPGPTDTDPVLSCEAELDACLASCDGGGCLDAEERMPTDPGDLPTAPETGCVDSCYAQYDACVNNPPKTCEFELDQCLVGCPMYDRPADGSYDEGSACIDNCYWQYDQCIGVTGECWSDYDCQPGYHCEFGYYNEGAEPAAEGEAEMPAESGVCVPDEQPNDCDAQLDQCLVQCGSWDCGADSDGAMEDCAPMPAGCEVECWDAYDRCLNGNTGECWSDWDCLPQEHCELYDVACPEGEDCKMAPQGVCVPDYPPEPCEGQLNECLASCPVADPMPCECEEGYACDCAYYDPCANECWVQYDNCLNSGTECWSDQDCQPGFHCELYGWDYDCEPGMDCGPDTMPAEYGTCVPDYLPEPCEVQLNECLMNCPVYDCECDPSVDYCDCGYQDDFCAQGCYAEYDSCLGGGETYCSSDEECGENEFCAWVSGGDEYCDESGYCYPTEPSYGICQPIEQQDPCLEVYDACMAECPMIDCDDPTAETCAPDEFAYECYGKCDALYWQCWQGPIPF